VNDDANLFAQQEANRRRSIWLVIGFLLFFAWVGFGGDLAFYLMTMDDQAGSYRHVVPFIGIFSTLAAAWICGYSWRRGPQRVLWATGAWELIEPATPEQKQLVNVVEEMSIASGLTRPAIYIVPDDDPNAFATGRDAASASIAVTEGLLRKLSRDELQAVVAHELAHIRNLDIRLMTLLAGMVGAIVLLSDGLGRMIGRGVGRGGGRAVRWGVGSGRRSSGRGAMPLAVVILVLWLLTLVIAPVVSRMLALAVSRKREYLADATAAQFTRNPMALASALEKLDLAAGATQSIGRGAAHLCIVDPSPSMMGQQEGLIADVMASHPPIKQRIIRLRGMAYQQAKREALDAAS
jgi:heat shock protein HtpX